MTRVMNGATVQMIREGLGMTLAELAAELGVSRRTVERWEAGTVAVARGHCEAIRRLEDEAAELVTHLRDLYLEQPQPVMVLACGEDDVSLRRQRAMAFLVRQTVPDLTVVLGTPEAPQEP